MHGKRLFPCNHRRQIVQFFRFPWKGRKSRVFPTSSGLAHPRQGVALRNKNGTDQKRSSMEYANDQIADRHFFSLVRGRDRLEPVFANAISDYGSGGVPGFLMVALRSTRHIRITSVSRL